MHHASCPEETCLSSCYNIITTACFRELFAFNCITKTGKQLARETRRNVFVSLFSRYFTVFYNLWSDHVLGWWKHRNDPNVLFLKYEDLKKVCHIMAELSIAWLIWLNVI